MKRAIALLLTLTLMMVSLASVSAQSALSQAPVDPIEGCEYYEATGHNVCEPFQSYWEANGGLPIFGYPITEAFEEVSLDTGGTYLVQYFERERLEHHPALAGSEYEILLGRLGNEVLLQQDRNWREFEKSDPSEDNYFAETGFAVPQVFLDYWMSYGLDLGDPGLSFRESLALFGYPISQAQMETNMAGDTVLTQWFERARFEHHPDNEAEHQVLLGLLGSELLAGEEPEPPPPGPEVTLTVITDEVLHPRHLSFGPDGALYVANAGMGGDNCVVVEFPEEEANGEPQLEQNGEDDSICFGNSGSIVRIAGGVAETLVDGLPSVLVGEDGLGIHSVVVTEDGDIYGVMGFGFGFTPEMRASFGEAAEYLGWLVKVEEDGSLTQIADLLQYEADENPDPVAVDSNPYSIVMDGDTFLVADAGGNTLLRVTMDGEISTIAVFSAQMALAPPFLGLPEGTEIPMESVPTDVVVGPDGAYYVSELTGFPFAAGGARIWRVEADGTAEVYATGFTNIGAIDFDSEGNLHVMEMVSGGLLQADPENPISAAGAVIKVHADGSRETLVSGASGLIFPTGMAIDADDTIYLANFGVIPGLSQIVRVDPVGGPVDPEPEQVLTTVAEGLGFPLHASTGGDGAIYVADGGFPSEDDECVVIGEDPDTGEVFETCFGLGGSVLRIDASGSETVVSGLPAISDVHVTADGDIYAVVGLGGTPEVRDLFENEDAQSLGTLIKVEGDGEWTVIADLAQFEADENPDPTMVDSNPYALTMDGDDFLVVDAGGNTLLRVTMDGEITVLAVFDSREVQNPFAPEGVMQEMESVPTDVAVGPDGNYYVGELTGFPFAVGAARVFQVTPEGDVTVFADGFSAIGSIDFDSEGNLYVLEIATGGLLAAEMASPDEPDAALSRVVQIAPDGTQTDYVTAGIYFATGLAIDNDDQVFIVNMSVTPMASVVRVDWVTPE